MGKPRACDVCSMRKIRCNGVMPCPACIKAGFECSFTKKPMKPGPKGPRQATCNRIKKHVQGIQNGGPPASAPALAKSTVVPVKHDISTENESGASNSPASASQHSVSDRYPPPTTKLTLTPFNAPPPVWASHVTLTDVYAYLEIFHYKMYPVWPVIDRVRLMARLQANPNDAETCALAFSICAATGAQLRLDSENQSVNSYGFPPGRDEAAMSDLFASEAERFRSSYDYRERATTEGILIPLFLHFYYVDKKKLLTSSFLLREAVTMCQLLDCDKEAAFSGLPPHEQRHRRKIFWLLYVTERGHAMQHDTGIGLSNSIELPTLEEDNEPLLFGAFLSLVHLFVSVEGILVNFKDRHGRSRPDFNKEVLSQLQKKLRQSPQWPSQSSELQKADIWVTRQWMRMLIWQLSMKNIYLSTRPGDESMSLTYPAYVAKDSLAFLYNVSLDSLIAHGPGMEIKLFEIANTLLDVINCVPAMSQDLSLMTQTPRDVLHSLCCLLSSIGSDQSHGLTVLQSKMAESKVAFRPIPRFIDIKYQRPASTPSNARNASPSAVNSEYSGCGSADISTAAQQPSDGTSTPLPWAITAWNANGALVPTELVPASNQAFNPLHMPLGPS